MALPVSGGTGTNELITGGTYNRGTSTTVMVTTSTTAVNWKGGMGGGCLGW